MVTSEVVIDEQRCLGCGYCVQFCPRDCLEMAKDKISQQGYYQPILTKPEQCNRCGVCVWMCPHWAIEVNSCSEDKGKVVIREKVAGPPRLALEPPLAGCPGCQHPTVGRMIAEVLDELGVGDKAVVLDAIPCAISSAFGMDFSHKLAYDERAPDLATTIRRSSPDAIVVAVQGYWGLADFSLDINSFIGALIRGEKFTTILCNMPYYGPKDGRPAPATEPAEGRLEPVTQINTPEGQKLIMGGYPLHIAELAAMFEGVTYSARGAITSVKDYQRTKSYIKSAIQKQMDHAGSSFVEVLCVCSDLTYSDPVDCLEWIKKRMAIEFPLGELKNVDQAQRR
jgi:2-oxoglutarate ferredoxin oxidoreductase subunit beta